MADIFDVFERISGEDLTLAEVYGCLEGVECVEEDRVFYRITGLKHWDIDREHPEDEDVALSRKALEAEFGKAYRRKMNSRNSPVSYVLDYLKPGDRLEKPVELVEGLTPDYSSEVEKALERYSDDSIKVVNR